jgi:hypothetical protein
VRRLLCAGRVRTVLRGRRGNVLDVGRSQRVVPDRLYRALVIRDDGQCGFPGCGARRGLDAHHVRHWIDGGRTDADNLILLCEAHHQIHHAGGFAIVTLGDGRFRFRRLDGTLLADHVNPATFIDSPNELETEHREVAAAAATTRWDGRRMDRDFAVGVFAQSRSRERCGTTVRPRDVVAVR